MGRSPGKRRLCAAPAADLLWVKESWPGRMGFDATALPAAPVTLAASMASMDMMARKASREWLRLDFMVVHCWVCWRLMR